MIVKCPKCENTGRFGWLGEPDTEGVIAMVTHIVGKKTIHNPLTDKDEVVDNRVNHFLTLNQIKDLEWFKKWQIEKEKLDKEAKEKMNKESEESYWKEVRNDEHL
jgi:hypothetical protein